LGKLKDRKIGINVPKDAIKFVDNNDSPDKYLFEILNNTDSEIKKNFEKISILNSFKNSILDGLNDF
jgi:hypothetical protein